MYGFRCVFGYVCLSLQVSVCISTCFVCVCLCVKVVCLCKNPSVCLNIKARIMPSLNVRIQLPSKEGDKLVHFLKSQLVCKIKIQSETKMYLKIQELG